MMVPSLHKNAENLMADQYGRILFWLIGYISALYRSANHPIMSSIWFQLKNTAFYSCKYQNCLVTFNQSVWFILKNSHSLKLYFSHVFITLFVLSQLLLIPEWCPLHINREQHQAYSKMHKEKIDLRNLCDESDITAPDHNSTENHRAYLVHVSIF